MELRLKIGKYAGEIREFPFAVALDLLKNDAAENPYAEPAVQLSVPVPRVAESPARAAKKGRK